MTKKSPNCTVQEDSAVLLHRWDDHRGIKVDPLPCLLCSDPAAVIVHAPDGCTCSPNKIQPRCQHHLNRAIDTGENIKVIEDFRLGQGWPHMTGEVE